MELINAAINGDINTIKVLANKPDFVVDVKNRQGFTALIFATQTTNTTSNIETVKLLLDLGANVNATDNKGNTALMFAVQETTRSSNIETVKLLLDRGADVNIRSNDGYTALMASVYSVNTTSNIETVKLLLDRGADVNNRSDSGYTALIYALNIENIELIELLLDYGANPYTFYRRDNRDVREILNKYRWHQTYNNIKIKSRQYSSSGDLPLPRDVWELILLRQKQQYLCENLLNDDNLYMLIAFAEMLEIPVTESLTKRQVCTLISEQLVWGGKYTPESLSYTTKRYNDTRETVIQLAYRLGIDIHQPVDRILDEIASILGQPL
jgi:hypothetical protein